VTFSYTGNPSDSNIDAVRFYCQDTNEDEQLLSDEEITFLLDTWYDYTMSTIYVASVAAETIAGRFAREVSYSADGVSVSGEQLQQKYNDLAQSLRDMYKASGEAVGPDAGGILVGDEYDTTIKPLSFGMGFNDNRRGGQQEFGGRTAPEYPETEIW
jgi:hypothetical protein